MTTDSLSRAYARVDRAYVHARHLVLDHYPDGLPHGDELNDVQRFALYHLHAAEAELDRARHEHPTTTPAQPRRN